MARLIALAFVIAAACAGHSAAPDATPSCWIHDCPTAPGSDTCGACVHPGFDTECPAGFVCSCFSVCVKGPRSQDAGYCAPDAGAALPDPDARMYAWPVCET